jgi:phenylalanine-4-hydroxylase
LQKEVSSRLSSIARIITLLDHNPDTKNPNWFPRRIRELDMFATRVLGACEDLESDHPGFHDQVYRQRRNYFATMYEFVTTL